MADIKLAKLPDRTPVKLAIVIAPELHRRLQEYSAAYADAYGQDEPLGDLVAAMISTFLDSDRAFIKRGRRTKP